MNNRSYVAIAIAAMLAGCDSGEPNSCDAFTSCGATGGSSGGTITLTQDNSLDALREAWFASSVATDMPAFIAGTGIGDMSGGTVFAGSPSAKMATRPSVMLDPFGPQGYNCPVSGTFIASGDVADPNTVTAGDFYNYDASACDSGTGFIVDGVLDVLIDSISGDPNSGMYAQGQTLTMTSFQATEPALVTTVNGDHTAIIDTTSAAVVTSTYSGNILAVEDDQATVTVRNFAGFASVQTSSPFNFELDTAGVANSTLIQGSFDFFTTETMVIPAGENPTDGHFDILGSGGSTARVVIFDQNSVRVQVDANGSSNYEISVVMTWDEFLAGTVPLTSANNIGLPD